MPYVISPATADLWSVEDVEAAMRAVVFANSVEEKRFARAKYDAVMEIRRRSGYTLPGEPLHSGSAEIAGWFQRSRISRL